MDSVVVIKDTRLWSTAIDLLSGGRVVGVSFTVLRHLSAPSGILHSVAGMVDGGILSNG